MSVEPHALERSWRRLAQGDSLDTVVLEEDAGSVREELRIAAALRAVAATLPGPDVELEWERLVARLESPPGPARTSSQAPLEAALPSPPRRPRLVSALLAATLTLLLAAGLSLGAAGAAPGSALYPMRKAIERMVVTISPRDTALLLRIAEARLDDLLTALRHRNYSLAPRLAADLVDARLEAIHAGADSRRLDERISREVPPILSVAPESVQRSVLKILGLGLSVEALDDHGNREGENRGPSRGGGNEGEDAEDPHDNKDPSSEEGGSDSEGNEGPGSGESDDGDHEGPGPEGGGEEGSDRRGPDRESDNSGEGGGD